MSITMEGTLEALTVTIVADRCPCCWMSNICTQEELEVLTSPDTIIQQSMSNEVGISRCYCSSNLVVSNGISVT